MLNLTPTHLHSRLDFQLFSQIYSRLYSISPPLPHFSSHLTFFSTLRVSILLSGFFQPPSFVHTPLTFNSSLRDIFNPTPPHLYYLLSYSISPSPPPPSPPTMIPSVLPVRAIGQSIHARTMIPSVLPARAIGQSIHARPMITSVLPVRANGQIIQGPHSHLGMWLPYTSLSGPYTLNPSIFRGC